MMNALSKILTFVFVFSLFLSSTSCKKDDTSKTDLLTISEGWKFESVDIDIEEIIDVFTDAFDLSSADQDSVRLLFTDEVGELEDCDLDDITNFTVSGQILVDVGSNKCTPDEPQTQQGSWGFTNNEEKIDITFDEEMISYDIDELSDTRFEVSVNDTFANLNGSNDVSELIELFGFTESQAMQLLEARISIKQKFIINQ